MTPPSAARLVTLTAIVVALVAAIGITGGGRTIVERPLIAPGLTLADVTGIQIMRDGAPPIIVAIDDAGIRVEAPVPGPADEATVRDLVSAVATARADRALRGTVDEPSLRVRLERRNLPSIEVARGVPVPASGQIWLGIDDRIVLVPAWVGAALDRDLASLRRRQVFPPVAITGVEIHGNGVDLVLAGSPLRRRDDGTGVRVARAEVARLDAALAAVVLDVLDVLLPGGDMSTPTFTARVLGGASPHELTVHGPCPGHPTHVLVGGSAGVGCIASSIVDGIVSAAADLTGAGGIEPSLAVGGGVEIESMRAGDTILARRGAGWVLTLGDERVDADDDAVRAFLDALAVEGVPGPLRTVPPTATWTVTLAGGAVETWRFFPNAVRRDDEPNAIQLGDGTLAAARRLGPPLRNLTLLVIDASMVSAIRATGLHPAALARAQLVGEWNPPSASANQLVDLLATFRGLRWLEPRELGPIRRTLTFTIDAPPIPGSRASTHTIVIGAVRANDRCAARVDAHLPIELAASHCATLLAPLTQ